MATTSINGSIEGVQRGAGLSESFSTIHDGAGTAIDTSGDIFTLLSASATTDEFQSLGRAVLFFDTSSLGNVTVTAASLGLYIDGLNNGLGNTSLFSCEVTPASTSGVSTSDYSQFGTSSFGGIAYASAVENATNTITLNASGLAVINTSGITTIGLRIGWDLNNSFGGSWLITSSALYEITGTPTLSITYAPLKMTGVSTITGISTITG